jgi:glycosyltransferase involved in cell wall biosynthesis
MRLEGRDIVCVGFSDWNADVLTNQQHLLARAADRNRILFVESLGLRRPQLAGRDLRRIAGRLVRGLTPPRVLDGVHVLSPLVLPLHSNAVARRVNARLLPYLVARAAGKLGLREPVLWSFVPQAEVLIDSLKPSKILYYIDDDHAAKPGIDPASFAAAEERFARRADVILASAPELVQRMRVFNDNVHFAPNVADTRLFATALEPGPADAAIAALPSPRVLFIGAILAATIDIELVVELARRRPDWSFAFVGPVGQGDPHTNIEALRAAPNVHLLGHRPQALLPGVLRSVEATIIPYRVSHQMASVFPMKTYEYLAAGRPVVATPLPALADVRDVTLAATAEEFAARLQEALDQDTPAARAARSAAAQEHSWESRLEQIASVLDAGPS